MKLLSNLAGIGVTLGAIGLFVLVEADEMLSHGFKVLFFSQKNPLYRAHHHIINDVFT